MPTFGGSRGSSGRSPPASVSWIWTVRTRGRLRHRRAATGPADLRLELRGEGEQPALAVRRPDQLDSYRQAVLRRARRGDGDRRLPGQVPDAGERIDAHH